MAGQSIMMDAIGAIRFADLVAIAKAGKHTHTRTGKGAAVERRAVLNKDVPRVHGNALVVYVDPRSGQLRCVVIESAGYREIAVPGGSVALPWKTFSGSRSTQKRTLLDTAVRELREELMGATESGATAWLGDDSLAAGAKVGPVHVYMDELCHNYALFFYLDATAALLRFAAVHPRHPFWAALVERLAITGPMNDAVFGTIQRSEVHRAVCMTPEELLRLAEGGVGWHRDFLLQRESHTARELDIHSADAVSFRELVASLQVSRADDASDHPVHDTVRGGGLLGALDAAEAAILGAAIRRFADGDDGDGDDGDDLRSAMRRRFRATTVADKFAALLALAGASPCVPPDAAAAPARAVAAVVAWLELRRMHHLFRETRSVSEAVHVGLQKAASEPDRAAALVEIVLAHPASPPPRARAATMRRSCAQDAQELFDAAVRGEMRACDPARPDAPVCCACACARCPPAPAVPATAEHGGGGGGAACCCLKWTPKWRKGASPL